MMNPQANDVMATVQSTRFGAVGIDRASVIEFPDGLIGLGGHRYVLLRTQADSPFLWLQSLDDPALALPVTNPHGFFGDFALQLDEDLAEQLAIDESTTVDVYVTVRTGATLADFAANLRAPIIVRDGRGHQVLNEAPGCDLRAPLFPAGTAAPSAA